MANPRFRATAAAVPTHDSSIAVVVLGGHHRCENMPDFSKPSDDGGCDEIAQGEAFINAPLPPLFMFARDSAVQSAPDPSSNAGAVVVSQLPALTGYKMMTTLGAGSGYWSSKASMPMKRSDFHVRIQIFNFVASSWSVRRWQCNFIMM
jgi:hypothetical protein